MPAGTHVIQIYDVPDGYVSLHHEHHAIVFGAFLAGEECQNEPALSAVAVDSTHVRVTFDRLMVDNAALRCLELWTIVPPVDARDVDVLVVSPEQDPVSTVLLTTTEFEDLVDYQVSLTILERDE